MTNKSFFFGVHMVSYRHKAMQTIATIGMAMIMTFGASADEALVKHCQINDDLNSVEKGPYTHETMSLDFGVSVHFPAEIDTSNCLHGVVSFGNGSGRYGGNNYDKFFESLAEYGFVVVVNHSGNTGSGLPLISALDVLYKKAQEEDHPFHKRLQKIAGVAGQSQGGLGASAATRDERVVAAVPMAGAGNVEKPTLFITSQADYMSGGVRAAYGRSNQMSIFVSLRGTGHAGIPFHDRAISLATSWYRCHLNQNKSVCETFLPECLQCKSSDVADQSQKSEKGFSD